MGGGGRGVLVGETSKEGGLIVEEFEC